MGEAKNDQSFRRTSVIVSGACGTLGSQVVLQFLMAGVSVTPVLNPHTSRSDAADRFRVAMRRAQVARGMSPFRMPEKWEAPRFCDLRSVGDGESGVARGESETCEFWHLAASRVEHSQLEDALILSGALRLARSMNCDYFVVPEMDGLTNEWLGEESRRLAITPVVLRIPNLIGGSLTCRSSGNQRGVYSRLRRQSIGIASRNGTRGAAPFACIDHAVEDMVWAVSELRGETDGQVLVSTRASEFGEALGHEADAHRCAAPATRPVVHEVPSSAAFDIDELEVVFDRVESSYDDGPSRAGSTRRVERARSGLRFSSGGRASRIDPARPRLAQGDLESHLYAALDAIVGDDRRIHRKAASGELSVVEWPCADGSPSSSRPVLVANAFGVPSEALDVFGASLASTRSVFSWETRGLPDLSLPFDPVACGLESISSDMGEITSACVGGPVHVMGWCTGALAAAHFALSHLRSVLSLTLLCPSLTGWSDSLTDAQRDAVRTFPILGRSRRASTVAFRALQPSIAEDDVAGSPERGVGTYRGLLFSAPRRESRFCRVPASDPEALYRYSTAMTWYAEEAKSFPFSMLEVPTLVLVSDDDAVTGMCAAERAVDAMPQARIQVMSDADHYEVCRNPLVAEIVGKFCAEVEAGVARSEGVGSV